MGILLFRFGGGWIITGVSSIQGAGLEGFHCLPSVFVGESNCSLSHHEFSSPAATMWVPYMANTRTKMVFSMSATAERAPLAANPTL